MKYYTYRLNLLILNILAVVMIIFMTVITFMITGNLSFIEKITVIDFLMIIIWLILHEILHGIGFLLLGKVKFADVVFGAELEKGLFYCMCKEKISKINILIALFFPLFFIGIITYIIGILLENNLLILLSVFNISGAVGDILMGIDIMMMPRDIKYLDLDDTTSFTILSNTDLSNKKYFAIKMCGHGKYKEYIRAQNYNKLSISKGTYYFLIIMGIIFLLSFFLA